MEISRKEYERRADQQDTDRDGLPDRADSSPKGQDFYYKDTAPAHSTDQQDTDRDGLPDRADSTSKDQDYYYKKVDPEQLDYLNDFADFPFTTKNGIVQVQSENKELLLLTLERQAHLLNLHDKP